MSDLVPINAKQCARCMQIHPKCTGHKSRKLPNGQLVPCANPQMLGKEVCRNHGGLSLEGPAHPNWKGGKNLKRIMTKLGLARTFARALDDPDLGSVRKELALTEARWEQLLEQLSLNGDVATALESAATYVRRLREAGGSMQERREALDGLMDAVERGVVGVGEWREVYGVMELRRRLAETDSKIKTRLKHTMEPEHAVLILQAAVTILKDEALAANFCGECTPKAMGMLRTVARKIKVLWSGGETVDVTEEQEHDV